MDTMESLFNKFAYNISEFLPRSPFANVIESIGNIPYLGYLNWFFPIKDILTVMALWLGAITVYYAYSIVLRWLKVIGD